MLSRDNFDLAMVQFGDYYAYDYTQNELAISEWWKVLSSQLEDSELYPCLKSAIAKFARRPLSPLEVIENFKPSLKSDLIAWEEWKSIQNAVRFPDNALILSPMAELALEALGGLRAISALPEEKQSYASNSFVKLWLMYEEGINNGTIHSPSPKLPETRQVFRSEPQPKPIDSDTAWWFETVEARMPLHILDKIKKLRREAEQSELAAAAKNTFTQVEVDGFSVLKDSF